MNFFDGVELTTTPAARAGAAKQVRTVYLHSFSSRGRKNLGLSAQAKPALPLVLPTTKLLLAPASPSFFFSTGLYLILSTCLPQDVLIIYECPD